MAKNYSSSNKNSYGEDGYNSTNKNKTNSSMGDKNASNKTSNKNAKNSSNKNASNASDRNCHDDRIFISMCNGAVCITDHSKYLDEILTPDENIIFYDLTPLDKLPEIFENNFFQYFLLSLTYGND